MFTIRIKLVAEIVLIVRGRVIGKRRQSADTAGANGDFSLGTNFFSDLFLEADTDAVVAFDVAVASGGQLAEQVIALILIRGIGYFRANIRTVAVFRTCCGIAKYCVFAADCNFNPLTELVDDFTGNLRFLFACGVAEVFCLSPQLG